MMDELQKKTLKIMEEQKRISPAFLARKLGVTMLKAQELFLWGYMQQAQRWFRIRNKIEEMAEK